ncbi:SNF2 family N-terminal domain-containing protein [Cryptosporidium muris RN66]|uniref:SNF2 family N-terminal domain-containing protein n=1 Tax=Cryptosporidium muris (strain RN66) TaxID=441375 RepID=B6A9L4_CRYMR|nr:SNF2 family N-terminal domain-containing protein [Cryptosporidium muris RN66]EEA04905.1 SNF2 family N-terminal domain-containing protein [Cryptosporidium muris RN66]|eukprot:XP_002139254.1 SNF2 family N-terminal domain-containing protein [Cryptosporidium muris RN66]
MYANFHEEISKFRNVIGISHDVTDNYLFTLLRHSGFDLNSAVDAFYKNLQITHSPKNQILDTLNNKNNHDITIFDDESMEEVKNLMVESLSKKKANISNGTDANQNSTSAQLNRTSLRENISEPFLIYLGTITLDFLSNLRGKIEISGGLNVDLKLSIVSQSGIRKKRKHNLEECYSMEDTLSSSILRVVVEGREVGMLSSNVKFIYPLIAAEMILIKARIRSDFPTSYLSFGELVPLEMVIFATSKAFYQNQKSTILKQSKILGKKELNIEVNDNSNDNSLLLRTVWSQLFEKVKLQVKKKSLWASYPKSQNYVYSEDTRQCLTIDEILCLIPRNIDIVEEVELNTNIFKSKLYPYQQQGYSWMKSRERKYENLNELHPLWEELSINKFDTESFSWIDIKYKLNKEYQLIYFNQVEGILSLEFPACVNENSGGILSDDMGLGKTIQTLALICGSKKKRNMEFNEIEQLFASSSQSSHELYTPSQSISENLHLPEGGTLIILPLSLMLQWQQEIEKHLNVNSMNILSYYGNKRHQLKPRNIARYYDIVLMTYGTLSSEYDLLLKSTSSCTTNRSAIYGVYWNRIVLDEAHFIKNSDSKVSKACSALEGRFRWCLTATPIQNTINDIYSLIRFLRIEPWCRISWWKQLTSDTATMIETLRRIISPIILRRTRDTIIDGNPIIVLPEKNVHTIWVELDYTESEIYNSLYQRSKQKFDSLILNGTIMSNFSIVLTLLLRLRQVVCHPLLLHIQSTKTTKIYHNSKTRDKTQDSPLPSCPVCMDYSEDPVNLPCKHILCRICALQLISKKEVGTASCPYCRNIFKKNELIALPGTQKIPKAILSAIEMEMHQIKEINKGEVNKNLLQISKTTQLPEQSQQAKGVIYEREYSLIDTSGTYWKPTIYSTKIRTLLEYLHKDINDNQKVVIFSQWTSFLDIIEMALNCHSFNFRRLDGSISMSKRGSIISWFSESKQKILLVSIKAGGVGLNLVAATRVYLTDLWWNPAVEEQALQRIYRLGQTKTVHMYRIVCRKSVEERILQLHQLKSDISSKILGDETNEKVRIDQFKTIFKEFV